MEWSEFMPNAENPYREYLEYLYAVAARLYSDCEDADALVQESIMAYIEAERRNGEISDPKAFLYAVMKNKYNSMLRKKYKNSVVTYDYPLEAVSDEDSFTETEDLKEEYAAVRREIGRLSRIYREVTVRHYVHGHSVDRIAADLNIPRGTVLSRLSSARNQIKEELENMEKYSSVSYEPKKVYIGIWGSQGLSGEPFSLLSSDIEGNILVLAYERPVSVKEISDAMGMPGAYIEPLVTKLICGELMGKTSGGLVYTKCFMKNYDDAFGDIAAQEEISDKFADTVWETVNSNLSEFYESAIFSNMNEKQKATVILFVMNQALGGLTMLCMPRGKDDLKAPPERPNAGRWVASCTVRSQGDKFNKYDSSGPVWVSYSKNNDAPDFQMKDCQSLFGDAHWIYPTFKYKFNLREILRFYASFTPCEVKAENDKIFELVPDFEKLCILRRDENGEIQLDIPYMTLDDEAKYLTPAIEKIKAELFEKIGQKLSEVAERTKNRVPPHVEYREHFLYEGVLRAYPKAQMLAIVEKGLMPYRVNVGKTPIILVLYKNKEMD